jgi:hypothetical protein
MVHKFAQATQHTSLSKGLANLRLFGRTSQALNSSWAIFSSAWIVVMYLRVSVVERVMRRLMWCSICGVRRARPDSLLVATFAPHGFLLGIHQAKQRQVSQTRFCSGDESPLVTRQTFYYVLRAYQSEPSQCPYGRNGTRAEAAASSLPGRMHCPPHRPSRYQPTPRISSLHGMHSMSS